MYSLDIKFKLLNKTHNRQELKCDTSTPNINITSSDGYSVIIGGFKTEAEAQKKMEEFRAIGLPIPRFDKSKSIFALPDNVSDDFMLVDKHHPQNVYSLKITGLPSIEEATKAIGKIELAFIKNMLDRQQTYQADFNGLPNVIGDEERGAADNGEPLIYKTRPLFTIGGGELRVEGSVSSSVLINAIEASLNSDKLIADAKLKLALDIYRSSFYEDLPNSRFLSLITILEVLSPKGDKDDNAQRLIDKWDEERKSLLETCEKGHKQSLKDLGNALKFAREQSIRSSIHDFVLAELGDTEKAKAAKYWYDVRSKLVHDGVFKNEKNISITIDSIVKEILQKKISEL